MTYFNTTNVSNPDLKMYVEKEQSKNRIIMKTFEQYHKENPEVWVYFRNTTLLTIEKGFSNYSAKGIFEIIRWHKGGDIKSDGFKVNNNYTPHYARMFMTLFPKYNGFFRTRSKKNVN